MGPRAYRIYPIAGRMGFGIVGIVSSRAEAEGVEKT
jgi:hypothetical protein